MKEINSPIYNFSDSCHCGDAPGSTVDDSYCNATCEGGAAIKKCGGSAYESVYGTGRYFLVYNNNKECRTKLIR